MFCPKCGCHAGPDTSRFCRNCGFRLDGVVQLLARNGAPEGFFPPVPAANAPAPPSPRKKGIQAGGKLLFTSIACLPLIFGLCYLFDSPGPLFIPVTVFFMGAMRMLYARVFEDEIPQPPALAPSVPSPGLMAPPPPASFLPGAYPPPYVQNAPTTGELTQPAAVKQPPSVAEPTTNLLNRSYPDGG